MGLQLPGIVWSFCLSVSGLEGHWNSSYRVLSVLDLSVNFRPRRTMGFHVSGIVWSFCLSISGLEGPWGSECRVEFIFVSMLVLVLVSGVGRLANLATLSSLSARFY